jgi:hypothetical protein
MASYHGPDSKRIGGRLFGLVEKWANDVAGTVAKEKNSIRRNFLSVSSRIRCLQGENQNKGGIIWSCEIVADKSADLLRWILEVELIIYTEARPNLPRSGVQRTRQYWESEKGSRSSSDYSSLAWRSSH